LAASADVAWTQIKDSTSFTFPLNPKFDWSAQGSSKRPAEDMDTTTAGAT
jgi:hypothetical protein